MGLREEIFQSNGDAVEVAAAALRHCRSHLAVLVAVLRHPCHEQWMLSETGELAERLGWISNPTQPDFFSPSRLEELAQWYAESCATLQTLSLGPEEAQALAARTLAETLEQGLGFRYRHYFRGRESTLAAGHPFPVHDEAEAVMLFGSGLTASPRRLAGFYYDQTEHLSLAPEPPLGLEVVFDSRYEDFLPRLDGDSIVGVCVPSEFSPQTFSWDEYEVEKSKLLFGVRPRDPSQAATTTIAAIKEAVAEGATLVVLPELCLCASQAARVHAEVASMDAKTIVVCGSYHEASPKPGQAGGANVSSVLLPNNGPVLEHRKFSPFINREGRREDLRVPGSKIVVWQGPNWSLCVLICKDILTTGVAALLAALRVRVVAVPAASAGTTEFVNQASSLLTAQACVIVSNSPVSGSAPSPVAALIARPYKKRSRQVLEASLPQGGKPLILLEKLNIHGGFRKTKTI